METASRIATKKETAEAREEFRKAEDQAASAKALATAAQSTVEAATAHSKALIAAAKKVDEEVNTQVEVDDDKQSNSSDSEVSDEDVGMDMGNVVQSIE